MTITYPIVKAIFDTLPIGYYLGRAIDCELSTTADSSFFNFESDKIIISYKMIADAATELPETVSAEELEQLVRGLLYHEVSHVILSPRNLKVTSALNIVEDERIESICRSLYLNTDFYDNIIKLNHFKGESATSADEAFYHLVRFHVGDAEWLKRCRNLLKEYADLTMKSSYSYCEDYEYDVNKFYREFIEWWNEEAEKSASKTGDAADNSEESKEGSTSDSASNGSSEETNSTTMTNEGTTSEDKMTSENDTISESKSDTDGSESETAEAKGKADETKEVDGTEKSSALTSSTPAHGKSVEINDMGIDFEEFKGIVNNTLNTYYDAPLISTLTTIITRAMKKNKRNGSAINAYSGKLNVRAVANRDDYRWWVQQNRAGHVRHNSNVHFNLFIDNSGSFYRNDEAMNKFIKALDKVEKSTPSFDFDVITINTSVVEWPNHNQIFESDGGNKLLPEIKDVIKKHQKAQATNYNIVLFDGDAHSDDTYGYGRPSASDPFKFFNMPNTIIISDDDNKEYIDAVHMTQAKVRYTYRYCEEFISIICNLLEKCL